ncbi:hypothetical protein SDC9_183856 [bioreactor metagenome]|uniref:Uncharacterized protein n=1 Tax=bioreactor metagenome TaxID=1076179 RepID=A0A645HBE5_9ZZZZ
MQACREGGQRQTLAQRNGSCNGLGGGEQRGKALLGLGACLAAVAAYLIQRAAGSDIGEMVDHIFGKAGLCGIAHDHAA